MKAIDRLYDYFTQKGLKPTAVEKAIGLSNGYFSAQKKRNADMGEGMMNKIIDYYRDLNPEWLLTGEGSMFREKPHSAQQRETAESSAYYKMYIEKDKESRELAKEVGRLEERIRQLEDGNEKFLAKDVSTEKCSSKRKGVKSVSARSKI